jgi:hypothetical protein
LLLWDTFEKALVGMKKATPEGHGLLVEAERK